MIITDMPFDMSLVIGPGNSQRSPGLHLTDIIHSLATTIGIAEDSATDAQLAAYGMVGFAWERVIEQGMALTMVDDRYVRPGEVIVDRIAGSPDLLDMQDSIVIDTKATFKSSKQLDDLQRNHWKWIVQLKGYCHMVDWPVAELWILPICGDWHPPMIGQPVRKRLQFTQTELVDNWNMLITHAKEKAWL